MATYRQKVNKLSHGKEATGITFGALADRWVETVSARMKPYSLLGRKISVKQLKGLFGPLAVRNMTAKDCDELARKIRRRVDERFTPVGLPAIGPTLGGN